MLEKTLPVAPVPGARGPRLLGALLVVLLSGPPLLAQSGFGVPSHARGGREDALRVHLVTLENQPAEEAVKLVLPLLSIQGSVEIQPGGNTVVIRDTLASLTRILPVLADFDHPQRAVQVSIYLFRAHHSPFSPAGTVAPALPELSAVVETLRRHMRYADYELLARRETRTREGEAATLRLDDGFRVRFQVGTVLGNQRLRLSGFEVLRDRPGSEAASMLRSNLNLWLDRPVVVALTRPAGEERGDESALLVVVQGRVPQAESVRER